MSEHQVFRCFLCSLLIALARESGVRAAGHQRKTAPGSLPSSQIDPTAEGSQVDYVNSGPLGPLYDFLIQNRLQRLCLLLRKVNLEAYLTHGGPWTIFAPTDGSFAFLPGGTLEDLERNPQLMRDFLLYHFVSGDLPKSQILDEMVVDSVQGSPLRFNIYGPIEITTVSGAEILEADLQFDLGRVHIIDRPLYPLPTYDLLGYLQVYHNEMYKLVISSGLAEFLSGGTFTIFAPDDKAFDYLSFDLKDALATNETLAQRVVLTHVLPASMFVRSFSHDMRMNSVGNAELLFTQRRGLTFINGVPILTPDVPVTNGVIHVVNRVLLPEGVDADCQCKPLDSNKGASLPGRPYESSRITPATRPLTPATGTRPSSRPVGAPAVGVSRPGVPQPQPRPGIASQRPDVKQPVSPISGTGQRTTSGALSGHGQRPSSSGGVGLGQRQVVQPTARPGQGQVQPPTPVPGKRKPFSPNRIPQASRPTPSPPSTRTQRPWNPPGDTILIDVRDDFEPAPTDSPEIAPIGSPPGRPGTIPAVIPPRPQTVGVRPGTTTGSRFPSQPSHQTRQPAHSQVQGTRQTSVPGDRTSYPGSPSFEDNTVDIQTGQYPETDYEPLTQRPGSAGDPQQGRRPGQQGTLQPIPGGRPGLPAPIGQRPGQSQVQPVQRPGQQVVQPRPGQQTTFQPGRRPGQSPSHQPIQQPGRIPQPSVQRPGQQTEFQPEQQPGQIPEQPDQIPEQPDQRPGEQIQFQPGQQPGRIPQQPIQRPGQQTQFQPGQIPQQPFQRPGQQTQFQPGQQTQFQPGQQTQFQPGQQTQFQPGQQPGRIPQQPVQRPGQQTQFQPSQRPGTQTGSPASGAPPSGRRPAPAPPTRRTPAPFVQPTPRTQGIGRPGIAQPTSAPGQQFVPSRTTSLFPTRRPGQSSHSTKGQTYDPQRHNPQRRPPGRLPSPQSSRQTATVPATSPGLAPQSFESNRQSPSCRRRGERVTPATQSLPICPSDDTDFEPCQRVDGGYDPSDPRPPCQESSPICYTPGEYTDPADTRPPCPDEPEQTDCRQPGEVSDPTDYRPLCPQTELPSCRMPLERPIPGDRRPLCSTVGRGTISPPISPQQQRTQRPVVRGQTPGPNVNVDCRQQGEIFIPGDRRPLCEENSPQVPTSGISAPLPEAPQIPGNRGFQQGRQPSSQTVPGTSLCRQPGERVTSGDRRPLCRVTSIPSTSQQVGPVGSQEASPPSESHTPDPNSCRQLTERPTVGDTRPVCRTQTVSGTRVQRPGSSQAPAPSRHGSPQRPSPVPARPSTQQRPGSQGSPHLPVGDVAGEPLDSPENVGSVNPDLPFQQQPGVRPPSRGSFTTRGPSIQAGQHGTGTQPHRPAGRQPVSPNTVGGGDQLPPGNQWTDNRNIPAPPGQLPGQQQWPTGRTPTQQTSVRRPGTLGGTGTAVSIPGIVTTTATGTSDGPRTLYEIVEDPALEIQRRPVKLTKIFELFKKAGLEYILTDPGPYTVFLPSDDAFLRLPKGVIEQLEADPNLLQQVLLFHVTTSEILPVPQEQSYFVPSFQGTPILVTMLKGGKLILISGAKAVAVTRASNGIFYVINQLIYPLPQDDVVSALSTRPDLKTVTMFIEITGLAEYLGDQPYTLFAPSDNAFKQLSEAAVQELMQNTTALRDLLLGHIITGAHYGREFLSGVSFPSMRGGNLKLNTVSFGYQVNDVNIKTPEIITGSGVIHVIDQVLLTPEDLRFIERLSNALEESPPSSVERQTLVQGSASPAGRPSGGTWRTHSTITVTYGSTGTRGAVGQQAGPGSPYTQHIMRGTFPVQGSHILIPVSGLPQTGTEPQAPGTEAQGLSSGPQRPATGGQRLAVGGGASTSGHWSSQTHGSQRNPTNTGQTFGTSANGHYSVVQQANDIGLSRFASLITNSGLSDKIQDGGTYTVLAPTDEALNALSPDVVQALDADPNQLRDLLQYHILPQKLSSTSLGNDETASTLLEGKKLRFNKYNNGQVLTALGVPVDPNQDDTTTSIRLIPVNQVLQPPSGNLLKIIEGTPELTEFYKAVKNAHVNWMLTGEGGVTLFAPSDLAFQALTDDQRKDSIENRRNFSELLKSHLVKGTLYTSGLQDGEQRRTENRKTLTFEFSDGGVAVNSILISHSDIPATNGVLHIIDNFL